ncbi:MAG: serpin family protein [Gemmataceae bacterium]|nr:serpin family protein [Gemmataceae bacterium]MCS7270727.1 serpin family protein [Gemmataceae bacterium]MDW8241737.1 serpin family protein [Thermogemmata sp.]
MELKHGKAGRLWNRRRFLQWAGVGALSTLAARHAIVGARPFEDPPPGGGAPAPSWPVLVESNTRFATDLYHQLLKDKPDDNHFLSPFSISTALAMTAAGARNKTAEEMYQVLHLRPELLGEFKIILRALNAGDPQKRGFALSTANALWAQQGYPWRPEYKQSVQQKFDAGLFDVDFMSNPEGSRTTINTWVERQTHDKIKNLLPPGIITPLTRLVLTNAIYFKGNWLTQFDKKLTQEQDFTKIDGSTVRVPLMHHSALPSCSYAEGEDFQALDIPYQGKELSMLIVLPRAYNELPALEKRLTLDYLNNIRRALRPQIKVDVYLPRFRVEASYSLKEPLGALGMKAAFSPETADFSGMHTGREKLFISAVLHKAFVEVNEEGTEAAAATAVVIKTRGLPPPSPVFRVDRPFLFFIRDRGTGSILFMGRVVNPANK